MDSLYKVRSSSVLLKYVDGILKESGRKSYIEPDTDIAGDDVDKIFNGLGLSIIEIYMSESGLKTGYNFRLNRKSFEELKGILSLSEYESLLPFKNLLPDNVLPFSIAIRLKETDIVGKTIYFYPTYHNNNKIKATSISEKTVLNDLCLNLSRWLNLTDLNTEELSDFLMLGSEFRGLGISLSPKLTALNVYVKMPVEHLNKFLSGKIPPNSINSETILISLI